MTSERVVRLPESARPDLPLPMNFLRNFLREKQWLGIVGIGAAIAAWWLASAFMPCRLCFDELGRNQLFPAPLEALASFQGMAVSGELWRHGEQSLLRIGFGFVAGSLLGLAVGAALGGWRLIENCFLPAFAVSTAIPRIALQPLFVVWFGIGETPKILLLAMVSYIVVAVSTYRGVGYAIKPAGQGGGQSGGRPWEAALVDGATHWQAIRFVVLPLALPQIFAGLRLAANGAIAASVVAEMIGTRWGLGFLVWNASEQLDMARAFVGVSSLVVLGVASYVLIEWLERRVVRW